VLISKCNKEEDAMTEVISQNKEKIAELEAQKNTINIGDVANFGINAAMLAWLGDYSVELIKHFGSNETLQKVREVPTELINKLVTKPFYEDEFDKILSQCFSNPDSQKKARETIEKIGLTQEDFAKLSVTALSTDNLENARSVRERIEQCTEKLTDLFEKSNPTKTSLISNIEEHYPYGIKGAVVTLAVVGGLALAASTKMARNDILDNQITALELQEALSDAKQLKVNSKIDPQTVSLTKLRGEIEKQESQERY
jgi:hypothetical protein